MVRHSITLNVKEDQFGCRMWQICNADEDYLLKCRKCRMPNVECRIKNEGFGGCQRIFGDGSVSFLRDNIDLKIYRALATRNGGEQVAIP